MIAMWITLTLRWALEDARESDADVFEGFNQLSAAISPAAGAADAAGGGGAGYLKRIGRSHRYQMNNHQPPPFETVHSCKVDWFGPINRR